MTEHWHRQEVPPADTREGKLPVWAQDLLLHTRRVAQEALAAADAARLATDPASSRAVLDPYAEIPVGLGPDPMVQWRIGRDGGRYPYISTRIPAEDRRCLDVHGSGPLLVSISASNVIRVQVADR